MLVPSRNILETLLASSSLISESNFDIEKIKFTIDAEKINLAHDEIRYKITNIISIFEEDFSNKNVKKLKSKTPDKLSLSKGKNVQWTSLEKFDKKKISSTILGGAHTNRKVKN